MRLPSSASMAASAVASARSAAVSSSPSSSRSSLLSPSAAARALSAAATSTPRSAPRPSTSHLASTSALSRRPRYSTVASSSPSNGLIKVTTLPNKVRVTTEATPGHFSAVGVYIDAGSRFERAWVPGESGVSHLIDRMAFKSTTNRSAAQMTSDIEKLGGNLMASSSRETIMYQSSMFNQDLPAVLSILADTITNPLLLPEELDAQREAAAWEIGEIWSKPEMILPEILHTTAYQGNTLGNPLLCPMESLEQMTPDHLRDFMRAWFTPERIVVAGAGMPHEQLVDLTEKYLGGLRNPGPAPGAEADALHSPSGSASSRGSPSASLYSSSSSSSSGSSSSLSSYGSSADFSTAAAAAAHHASISPLAPRPDIAAARARYTGGELYDSKPELEFLHIYVAFEGLSIHDPDVYALATLQILLGGGGSFSAGGPGKGMYSRLYSNVLNQYHAVDFCAAFHHCYADSGLFGIAASVTPTFGASMASIIARELDLCTGPALRGSIQPSELARARNQLKSSLVMALESRLVEVEDLGRQVQVHGHKVSVEEMCQRIDEVDLDKLYRVANRVLKPHKARVSGGSEGGRSAVNFGLGSGQATVVAQGNLDKLGDVRQTLASRGLGLPA